ncbi:benzodiazepine receptor [Aureococcus anophagefferens]|nr:benzodiazepine receptor [Aureococcus anophagefferens]
MAAMKLLVCVALASARLTPLRKSLVHRAAARRASNGIAADPLARGTVARRATNVRGGVSGLSATFNTLVGAVVETAVLLGVVEARRAPPSISELVVRFKILPSETVRGLSAVQWASWFVIIYGSSLLGSVADGGLRRVAPDPHARHGRGRAGLLLAVTRVMGRLEDGEEPPWLAPPYCGHLALGAWNKVFFGAQQVRTGALFITAFYGALVAAAVLFYGMDQVAGLYMLPTVGWVTIAASLNWSIDFRQAGAPKAAEAEAPPSPADESVAG